MTYGRHSHIIRLCTLALAVPLAACFGGSDDGDPGVLDQVNQMREAAEAAGDVMEQMEEQANTPPAEPVDFRVLRDILPEELAGLPRNEFEGEKTQLMGSVGISQARALYLQEADDSRRNLEVEIKDMGGVTSFAMFGLPWLLTDMDKETNTGYERTAEIEGHPGYEEYDNSSERGEVAVLVAGRFLVTLEGRHLEMDAIKDALGDLDLDALEDMKDEGMEEGVE